MTDKIPSSAEYEAEKLNTAQAMPENQEVPEHKATDATVEQSADGACVPTTVQAASEPDVRCPLRQSEPRTRAYECILSVRAEWLLALLPLCLWSWLRFGIGALMAELISMLACTLFDYLLRALRYKKGRVIFLPRLDLTPAVIGLLIAFLLPPDCPLWVFILSALIAAVVGRLFGSASASPVCLPALAVIAVRALFPSLTAPTVSDAVASGTILEMLLAGEKPNVELTDLLLGRQDGMLGEGAVLLILLAAVYLIFRHRIAWQIPVAWLAGGALAAYLTAPETMSVYYYTGAQLLTGGFLLVGCLIAPFRASAPLCSNAGLVIGLIGGVLTILFRNQLGADGVLLAVLICHLLARPLDRWLAPVPFGGRRK